MARSSWNSADGSCLKPAMLRAVRERIGADADACIPRPSPALRISHASHGATGATGSNLATPTNRSHQAKSDDVSSRSSARAAAAD